MARLVRSVPPLPHTERGAFCIVNTDAPGDRVVYCSGSAVIWRSVAPLLEGNLSATPEDIFAWRGHIQKTTCAAISPNGNWVASGDTGGAVRVWGSRGEHIQKNEFKLWSGAVKDLAWSSDSTRLVACGDGKEVKSVAMLAETGNKTGEVTGHTKQVNSISFRNQRPYRVVTCSEDMTVAFHQGPPFKFSRSHDGHTNFVNSVRYSPDGEWVVSAGSDSKLILYAGQDGDVVKEFQSPKGMAGTLWAAAWAPDSARIATAGGDKKLRIWDRDTGAQVSEALVGSGALEDMLVSVTWPSDGRIISTCLDGRLLFWDVAADGTPTLAATTEGTQGPLTCLACDGRTRVLVQGGSNGSIAIVGPDQMPRKRSLAKGVQHIVAHSSSYAGEGSEAWVIGLDDCARQMSLETGEFIGEPVGVKEFSVAAGWLDVEETKIIVATGTSNFHCVAAGGVQWSRKGAVPRRPTALASLPGAPGWLAVALERPEGMVAGAHSTQFDIMLFGITSTASEDGVGTPSVLTGHLSEVTALRFSPSGEFLASADAGKKVLVWNMAASPVAVHISDWCFHTARITCLDWLPGGRRLVTGSLDQNLYVWDVDNPKSKEKITEAHKGGVTAVAACGDGAFASVGHDGFLQIYSLS